MNFFAKMVRRDMEAKLESEPGREHDAGELSLTPEECQG